MKRFDESARKKSIYEKSFFMNLIYRVTTWFYALVVNGFFGSLFTAYSAEEQLFERSSTYQKLKRIGLFQKLRNSLKRTVSKAFEDSKIITLVTRWLSYLMKRKLKEYGALFSVMGAVGLLVYTLEGGSFYVFFRESSYIISCVGFMAVGLAFVASKKTLTAVLYESHIMSELLFEGFGIQKDFFVYEEQDSKVSIVPIIAGAVLGGLSYFVNPTYYVIAIFVMLAATLIIIFPELGILAMLAVIPTATFFAHPSLMLLSLGCFTAVSFFIKLLRGKRMARFRLIDIAIMAFIVIRLTSGVFGAGGTAAFVQSLMAFGLALVYFLAVNLIRNKEWIKRSVSVFVLFAVVSLIIGVFQMFVGGFESGWLDSSAFSDITVRISSTFNNPNNFAAYILLLIPFLISLLLESKSPKGMVFYGLAILMALVCMVQTWSRGAWLGLCVSIVVFFLVYSRKSLPYLAAGGAVSVLGISMFAPTIENRFLSIGNLSESSISYRISAWKGIFDMLGTAGWVSGIGFGEASFSALYPAFAYSGAWAVKHAHSLYLQIITESGIPVLLLFIVVMILFVQNCFEYLYRVKNPECRNIVVAGVSSVIGFLVMGLTDYVWYNSRVYLAFWLVLAMVNANIRVGFAEHNRNIYNEKSNFYSADLEIDPESIY